MSGRTVLIAGAALVIIGSAAACASSTTPSTNSSLTLHAEVSDPAGDAAAVAGVPTSPDLIHGTVDVGGGNLTVTIQFAPGTLSLSTLLGIGLDTDQNPSTGIVAATGLGIDYLISLDTDTTVVQRATPATCASSGGCYAQVSTTSVSWGTETVTTTVPLWMLGNATGQLNYRVYSSVLAHPTITTDYMPDIALPPAHIP